MNPHITIRTLTDGGQRASRSRAAIAEFIDGADEPLDLAQYDFDLGPETAAIVGDAIRRAAAAASASGSPTTSTTAARCRCRRLLARTRR